MRCRGVLPRWLAFIVVIIIPAATAIAQPRSVSLQEAVDMAIEHSPRMMMAETDIQRAHAMRGEAWDGGNTSVSYAWGQLNGELKGDNELSVEQSLGSLLTPYYKNALAKTMAATGEARRDIVRRELTAEVRRAWHDYLAALALCRLWQGEEATAARLRSISELRLEQGDINNLEHAMINTMAAEQHTQLMEAQDKLALAARRFQWACRSEGPIVPADTVQTLQTIPIAGTGAPEYGRYFDLTAQQKADMVKIEKSKYFPELSLGYTRQKIAPMSGLNSWMVGVSFPLIFFPQKSRVRQARLEALSAQYEAEENHRQLSQKVEELRAQASSQAKRIAYYTDAALREADALQQNAISLYKESETSMTELIHSLNAARDIRRQYIEAVHEYNVTATELELYSE